MFIMLSFKYFLQSLTLQSFVMLLIYLSQDLFHTLQQVKNELHPQVQQITVHPQNSPKIIQQAISLLIARLSFICQIFPLFYCFGVCLFLIKLYIIMSEAQYESRTSHLEELFSRAKPKARYISESHIQEETGSITKQIINGDIQIRKVRGNLDLPHEKNNYEDVLRRKFIQQIEKEKQELEHKLGYIENSLVHFQKYDYLKRRSSLADSMNSSRKNGEDWRKEFEEQMKRLQQKKKQIAQKTKEKQQQTQKLKAKVQEQEIVKKKAELADSIKKMKERMDQRQAQAKQQKEKLKELINRKELFHKFEQRYQEKEENVLEQRKKKLAEIRRLNKPINLQEIMEHEQKFLDIIKQKDMMRNQQKKMMSSRARSYRPSYQSAYYKQIASPSEQQPKQNGKQKLQKMRQFSEQVKSKYIPQVDENKRRQMEERLQHENKYRQLRQQKQKELLQKPKIKGMEYLELVKKLPKKRNGSPPTAPETERVEYKNYLGSISVDMGKQKPWKTVLKKGEHKVQTAQFLQFQSEKLQQKLKRKEQYSRVMKIKDDGSIDQQYYEMVKAKLDLLAKD